jgi:hypothetical protein
MRNTLLLKKKKPSFLVLSILFVWFYAAFSQFITENLAPEVHHGAQLKTIPLSSKQGLV